MEKFIPSRVYYEDIVQMYEQGRQLLDRYGKMGIPLIPIEAHHKIEELKQLPNTEFTKMKQYLILGTRKTIKLSENDKSADYIVPFTSSGCTAMCLYCYLVCHFNKNSYLRVFVNRDEMMKKIKKTVARIGEPRVYELGSNSDMLLENTITGNLKWAIEQFGLMENATATFATKFDYVDDLLDARHNGHTQMRISVNPQELVAGVEFGTSPLKKRIEAANKMYEAGYRIGINVAPVMLVEGWRDLYEGLFVQLKKDLCSGLKKQLFVEVIFMTYALPNYYINTETMPNAIDLLEKDKMRPKGPGKYCYRKEWRDPAQLEIEHMIAKYLPEATISYIV